MGRMTEIIHYLNNRNVPTREWMRLHYGLFVPTYEDEKARERFRKGLKVRPTKGRLRMKPIFDT